MSTAATRLHGLPLPRQQLAPRDILPRHRHALAYAALVLAGGYVEAGDQGRRRLAPGDVVLHAAFAAHGNTVDACGAQLLNLPLPGLEHDAFGHVADPDAIVRLAERDLPAAAAAFHAQWRPREATLADWPDLLARDLRADPCLSLARWARRQGLAAESLSRGFGRAYGLSPRRLAHELRTRRALQALCASAPQGLPLAQLALDCGFADQAHLTHAVTGLTGQAPGRWRAASSRDKTAP